MVKSNQMENVIYTLIKAVDNIDMQEDLDIIYKHIGVAHDALHKLEWIIEQQRNK